MIFNAEVVNLTPRQRQGRAVNAVADLLEKRLRVPNIYLEPWRRLAGVDVLAVDRAGAGDIHAVEIKLESDFTRDPSKGALPRRNLSQVVEQGQAHIRAKVRDVRKQLMSLPAHYRYLAIENGAQDLILGYLGDLYPADGIGRLGIIAINDRGKIPPTAELVIAPERFRVTGEALSKLEKDLINNRRVRPDIEVRI